MFTFPPPRRRERRRNAETKFKLGHHQRGERRRTDCF